MWFRFIDALASVTKKFVKCLEKLQVDANTIALMVFGNEPCTNSSLG